MASHTAAQSQTGTAGDIACDQSMLPIAREKASTAWVGVELRKHLDTDHTVDAWVGSEANDRGVAL